MLLSFLGSSSLFRQFVLAGTMLYACGLNANAQAARGQEEFSISGDLFVPVNNTPSTTGLVSFDIRRYFTRHIHVGVGSTFNFFGDTTDNYNSSGIITGTTTKLAVISDPNVFVRYNFIKSKNRFPPYLGVEAGTSIQSDGNYFSVSKQLLYSPERWTKVLLQQARGLRLECRLSASYQGLVQRNTGLPRRHFGTFLATVS